MIETLKSLRDQVLRELDEADDTGTTKTLVNDALNQAHVLRCTEFPWSWMLWPREHTFSTVAGQEVYALHPEFSRMLWIRNVTSGWALEEVGPRMLPQLGVLEETTASSGSPQRCWFVSSGPVEQQPSAAGTVTLVSSSASDTFEVLVRGEDSSGRLIAEILTLTGTSPVTGSSTFRLLTAVTKEQAGVGTLTLTMGGTTLLTLFKDEMGRKYPQVALHPIPDGVYSVAYRFYRQPFHLLNDFDQPELPGEHATLLVWDALVRLSSYWENLSERKVSTWKRVQQQAQDALYQSRAQQHALEGMIDQVRYIDPAEG